VFDCDSTIGALRGVDRISQWLRVLAGVWGRSPLRWANFAIFNQK